MIRWFETPCDLPPEQHRPGDRHWSIGAPDTEWTGEVETLVCPDDDVPMHGRDAVGWLCCQVCGRLSMDVPRREHPPMQP